MKKKVLVIGASILQLPAILKAKEMGLEVAVADFNPNAIGIEYADHFFNASTIDQNAICEVAKEYKPDGIMTLATDMPMRSVAASTHELGLVGISMDTAIKATDKGEMIKAFKEHGVSSPWFYIINEESELIQVKKDMTYPCIVKPTDNAGSRGVVLVNSENELLNAYKYSKEQSRQGGVIVEEYMQGMEVSVEVMVVDKDVHILAITDKMTTGAPHFVETGHNQPSRISEEKQNEIRNLAASAVRAVGIDNGPAHVEIMLTTDGPKMIELGARMGGDCITTHLVPLSTGIDMVKATISLCLGEEPDLVHKFHKGSAIRFIKAANGTIKQIEGRENAQRVPGVKEVFFTKGVGDQSGEIQSSVDRVGYVIAQGNSYQEAVEACEKALNQIKITVE